MRLISSIVLSFLIANVVAQAPFFKNYDEQNGLSSSEVYQVYEDRRGFIWFATDNGVVKFDGENFISLNKSNGLADQVVFGFHEDGEDLWFRTFSGLTSFHRHDSIYPYPYNATLRSLVEGSILSSIVPDRMGGLSVGTSMDGMLARIDSTGNVTRFPVAQNTLYLHPTPDNHYLIAYTGASVDLKYVSIEGKSFELPSTERENSLVVTYSIWKDNLYFALKKNIFRYDGNSVETVWASDFPIISLSVDRKENLWVGYLTGGVHKFCNTNFEKPERVPALTSHSVSTVLQDSEGGYWMSTLEKGVYYFPNLNIHNETFNDIVKIYTADADNDYVYTGNYQGHLNVIDGKTRKIVREHDFQSPILQLIVNRSNSLVWVSTVAGTYVIDRKGKILKAYEQISSINDFFIHGTHVWAINQSHLYKFDGGGNVVFTREIDFWGRSILIDNNRMYLGGVSGLFVTDTLFSAKMEIARLANYKVRRVLPLRDGKYLVATIGNGCFLLSGDSVLEVENFMPTNIYAVQRSDSLLWLGTGNGIVKIATSSLQSDYPEFDFVNRSSGLVSDKINLLVRCHEDLWAFSDAGYSIVHEHDITFSNKNPGFYHTSIEVNNNKISLKDDVLLKYDENNLTVHFGFISFNNRDILVRHKIRDGGSQWNPSDVNRVSFYSLSPDSYDIKLQYTAERTRWMDVPLSLKFTITPPWWETLSFRLSILVGVSLIIVLLFYLRFRALKEKNRREVDSQQKLRLEKERMATDLHDNIGSQLTFVSLGLNKLVREVNKPALTQHLQDGLDNAMVQLRNTIWAMNKDEISVEELENRIMNLFWQYHHSIDNMSLTVEVDPSLRSVKFNSTQTINLFRIIQESITNSIKHSRATQIRILFQKNEEEHLKLEIIDNGIGFDPGLESEGGYGLQNLRRRAEIMGAQMTLMSSPKQGTNITIQMALNIG